ncbi:exonuclease domain-containing protein [Leuconostoc palmae]|uniref:exonuclease domain-containing protein n=1 Tax=Leuconostoc palmae TaxID=501487 RepID=UPI001C7D27B2|nr:exonuclease domain-containing protein [Leuconostoc palmae]
MNANKTFVVVDLETTGQSVSKGGRIIQIGMTFIKNRRVFDHFDTFVNPGQSIDRNIQQLTHISQKDVRDAPYFEEVVPVIQSILQDTIIVAHNINFDFPYLNDELRRTGFSELPNAAIDTVQLAQILLPTAPGYRLLDLTNYLNITLNHAHRANADAHATALLFLKLWDTAEQLPIKILKQLQFGPFPLLRQTQDFLKLIKIKKSDELFENNDLVVIKKLESSRVGTKKVLAYPSSVQDKHKQFGQWLTLSDAQNHLMNRIHLFISKRSNGVLTLLTTPKIGKTLGYIMPLIYQNNSRPIILLTNDDSLQKQQELLIKKLSKFLDVKMNTAILYNPQSYIDISKFNEELSKIDSSSEIQLLKARILVWLAQTETGLIQEIQVGAQNTDFLEKVHGEEHSLFVERAHKIAMRADILIMNFESFFDQSTTLLHNKGITTWPVVVMETPSQFQQDLQDYYHVDVNITEAQNSLKGLLHQEISGLSHKQRLFIRQSINDALKLIKQIQQSDSEHNVLKKIERLCMIFACLSDVLIIANANLIPINWKYLNFKRDKLERLMKQDIVCEHIENKSVNGQDQKVYHFSTPAEHVYQVSFIKKVAKLLVVSEYLDSNVSQFIRDVPTGITVEKEFIRDDRAPVELIQLNKISPIVHIQAITQTYQDEILIIVPTNDRVNHWYQKMKHAITTDYQIVAEGITGSLEKIQRQSFIEQQNIIIATPKIFSTIWLRERGLPRIVIVPEKQLWQPVSRLAMILVELQRHTSSMLITQLNAMQRNRFKSQLHVVKNFDKKNNLIESYNQILKKI